MPALVVGIVELFYNSAGGFLILLGGLINIVPRPALPGGGGGGSSLPVFQVLGTETGLVMVRSVTGTVLCVVAAALLISSGAARKEPRWWLVGGCCFLAAIDGGWIVGLTLVPALAVCGGRLPVTRRRV